ncbi:MAG: hypothetical protein MR782_01065 [Campylobacter sp.]|uniref:hypothetical protein n=1 Tax=Campylobacter sp. TaxID=205 RepID=UPI002A7B9AA3|nr:hypothetical protein [Campylobacter sp.]MDD7323497.1 hypothetical protein [Campylobacteraceae bacterium]MDY2817470.1 hypothetical protein [Campylobacter lanienae]MCI6339442.1 hypothetical protein [Campylobacter sp.]MCI7077150.1 hypothetical protein [Campylobacter sp.]MCI7103134.1 hypothetical protein [Campylobacter sp.]
MIYYTDSTLAAFLAIFFVIYVLAKVDPIIGAKIKKFFLYFLGCIVIALLMLSPIALCIFFALAIVLGFYNAYKREKLAKKL